MNTPQQFFPKGIYYRQTGYGIKVFRVIKGAALGDIEISIGRGKNIDKAIQDAKSKGNWPSDDK